MYTVIRTKRPAQYFEGELRKDYFPLENKRMWHVTCASCAGGGRKVSMLSLIDIKTNSRKRLVTKLRSFANREKYLITFSKNRQT
jgi:hypothetical protein